MIRLKGSPEATGKVQTAHISAPPPAILYVPVQFCGEDSKGSLKGEIATFSLDGFFAAAHNGNRTVSRRILPARIDCVFAVVVIIRVITPSAS